MKAMELRAKRVAALAAAGVLSAGMIMPMGAAFAGTNYTPVAGTNTTFKKYLVVSENSQIPNTTFNFSIAPGTAQAAGNGTMAVLAGVGTPTIAANQATFGPSDTTYTSAQTGDIDIAKQGKLEQGEKYAKKNVTIDFSSVNFPEPGVYRYIVSETAATTAQTAAGISCDSDTDRTLDVYVTDDGNGHLVVSGYVMHDGDGVIEATTDMGSGDVQKAADALHDKNDGFTNETETHELKVGKTVAGNQASRDKYFAITVALKGLTEGNKYTVSLADDNNAATEDGNADATSGSNAATIAANAGKTNVQELTADADGKAEATFYLQHGQDIVIRGLPKDATYTVTENAEDYKSSLPNGGATGTMTADDEVAITNTRDGIIPTGILFPIIGGIAVVGGAGAGLVANRRRKDEE